MGGLRAVREELERAARDGRRIRVLTTVFTGTTEVAAVEAIAALPGAEIRISYDVRRTRLHAKAWLFERATELHTAYVGSANLTATALGSGLEWMVKICGADLPGVIDKFRGTFLGLWNDAEFEPYDASSEASRERLRTALRAERHPSSVVVSFFTFTPLPFQLQILDRLEAERTLHQRHRNLVVAATGTGKTVIAAFDYLRACERAKGVRPRLLFLAHRREILEHARNTFRQVLRDGAFGELNVGGEVPDNWEYVFATIQSAAANLESRFTAEHFRFVIIDECHHAPADSYQKIIKKLRPEILLGLTATPERSDGKSLLPDFDGRIAAELRLWHALDRQLLVPFEYYGVADAPGTDLASVRWSRQGYQTDDLSKLYTGNEARVDLIVAQLQRRVVDVRDIRALAFCVSKEHAEFMARALTARGIPADFVHGDSHEDHRARAPKRLELREVNVLCTCDLYNEGVDLPFVDTLLLLRPTTSATLFVQQIGRGLRLSKDKTSCLILDFIGQHRAEFRFDGIYSALTGIPRGRLKRDVEEGFPLLPSGCVFQLDRVAKERVLESVKLAVANAKVLARELREMSALGEDVKLARFLDESGRDVEDVYRAGGWTALRGQAGVLENVDEETADLSGRLERLLHTDDATQLAIWRDGASGLAANDDTYARRLTMLEFQLNHRGVLREPTATAKWLFGEAPIRDELDQLGDVLANRIGLPEEIHPVAEWPLALHRHYRRREVVAAVGFAQPGKKGVTPQGGILKLADERRELLLVTLDKSSSTFSPTTRYRDYAISPTLFHWETQGSATVEGAAGRRYLDAESGWSFFLFVRTDNDAAYAFLGRVTLEAWSGEKPIGITWRLEHAMAAGLFESFATLAQG